MPAAVVVPSLPSALPRETPPISEALFVRICRTAYASVEPGFRSAGVYRFDAPDRSFGTLYAARDFKTCFFETIVRDRPFPLPLVEYDSRSVAAILVDTSALHLVPVHGDAAKALHLNQAQLAAPDYAFTQALAKAIHDHADKPHGMVYRSRYDDDALAIVLFERGKAHVRLLPSSEPIALNMAKELTDALRQTVPFEFV
jgi:RES domain